MTSEDTDALRQELERVRDEAFADMVYHAQQARLGRTSRYFYGLVSALLAAAAGTTALAEAAPGVVAVLAFASPVVASLQQLVRPESRAAEHHNLRARYESLYRRTRVFIDTKFDSRDLATAGRELDEQVGELDKLRRETPGDLAVHGPDVGLFRLWGRVIRGKHALSPDASPRDAS